MEDVWSNANISFSLCISVMWIRCLVSSHRCTRVFFFSSFFVVIPVQKRSAEGVWVCILYFPIFIMPKKTHWASNMHQAMAVAGAKEEKENHFSSRKPASNVQEAFFCNFYHRLTRVLCLPWRCYESIIWLSFILSSILNGDWNSS